MLSLKCMVWKSLQRRASSIWFLFLTVVCQGQKESFEFQHLNAEQGLSHNIVNCVIQDRRSYIWIGTRKGLDRYDGHFVKSLETLEPQLKAYLGDEISCSYLDGRGRLWFGTTGLICYDPESHYFHRYLKGDGSGLSSNDITKIVEDEFGNLWIATRIGLNLFNSRDQKFRTFLHDTLSTVQEVYSRNRITDMVPDLEGNIWISCIIGLYRFSISEHRFTGFLIDSLHPNSTKANKINALSFDCNGKLWLAFQGRGLCLFDLKSHTFQKQILASAEMQEASGAIADAICDSQGNMYFGCKNKGLLVFMSRQKKWRHHRHDPFDPTSLSYDGVNSVFEDCSGMIWLTTEGKGVDRFYPKGEKFERFLMQYGKSGGMCFDDITDGYEGQEGKLWLGSKTGLMQFDRVSQTFHCYTHQYGQENSLEIGRAHV